jgi:hypothetical protein
MTEPSGSLADKLAVEAKALADLKVEKAAVKGERRTVEADLGPVRYPATLLGPRMMTFCGISSSLSRRSSTRPRCSCSWQRRGHGVPYAVDPTDHRVTAPCYWHLPLWTKSQRDQRLSADRKGRPTTTTSLS